MIMFLRKAKNVNASQYLLCIEATSSNNKIIPLTFRCWRKFHNHRNNFSGTNSMPHQNLSQYIYYAISDKADRDINVKQCHIFKSDKWKILVAYLDTIRKVVNCTNCIRF